METDKHDETITAEFEECRNRLLGFRKRQCRDGSRGYLSIYLSIYSNLSVFVCYSDLDVCFTSSKYLFIVSCI